MAQLFSPGEIIDGRFVVEKSLGQGAFGAVFQVRDTENEGKVAAVKVLLDKYHDDRKMRQRFLQEAKLLARLDHPSVTPGYHWKSEGDLVYLVMELVDGLSLDERCEGHSAQQQFIPKSGVAWMCDQLCAAVDYAHGCGVIHRDLKPKNVMVNRPGERPFVKVLDFGIAKVLVGSEVDPTTVGRVLGSVLYIAPEQILSRPVDQRCDLFALGTILFEILTLRRAWARSPQGDPHPFHEPLSVGAHNSHVAVLRRISKEERPSACQYRPDLSPAVDEVLKRALAIDADERFQTAMELAAAFRLAVVEDRVSEYMTLVVPAGVTTVPNRPLPEDPSLAQTIDAVPPSFKIDPAILAPVASEPPTVVEESETSAAQTLEEGPPLCLEPATVSPEGRPRASMAPWLMVAGIVAGLAAAAIVAMT